MHSRPSTPLIAVALLAAALLIPSPAASGDPLPRVKPAVGTYELRPTKITSSFSAGAFAVVSERGKRRIVSSEQYSGIFYPDFGQCDSLAIPLTAESIPVNGKGRFSIRDSYPVKAKAVVVMFKGAWVKPKKVAGTVRIAYKGCKSKLQWVGRRAASIG